ncbi:MAG: hypothetical protein Q9173_000585 [Seirophora scorigena]
MSRNGIASPERQRESESSPCDVLAEQKVTFKRCAWQEVDEWKQHCEQYPERWLLLWTTLHKKRFQRPPDSAPISEPHASLSDSPCDVLAEQKTTLERCTSIAEPHASLSDSPCDELAGQKTTWERGARQEVDVWEQHCEQFPELWRSLWTTLQEERFQLLRESRWPDSAPNSEPHASLYHFATTDVTFTAGSVEYQDGSSTTTAKIRAEDEKYSAGHYRFEQGLEIRKRSQECFAGHYKFKQGLEIRKRSQECFAGHYKFEQGLEIRERP